MTQRRIDAVFAGAPIPAPGKLGPHGWMFDAFRLDLHDKRLWRGQAVIHLNPKAFAVLRCLVSRAGQRVTKDALSISLIALGFAPEYTAMHLRASAP
jgi:DNA-binding response OmpR family regulator